MKQDASKHVGLFSTDLPEREWVNFQAKGFSTQVTGVVYRSGTLQRAMPLGGIGTGFMHLGADGLMDRNTIFNSFLPSGASVGMSNVTRDHVPNLSQPFLGLAVDDDVWVLALQKSAAKSGWEAITDDRVTSGYFERDQTISYAKELHYWGHYPVADMEFDTTAPVSVGLRAWTPFILGDAQCSNTPGSIFEVQLRNASETTQHGFLLISFPGWGEREAHLGLKGNTELRGAGDYPRQDIQGQLNGVHVTHSAKDHQLGYVLGVIEPQPLRTGGCLGWKESNWSRAAVELPQAPATDPGSSLAIQFDLEPGQEQTLHCVLAWYAPFWRGRPSYNWPYVTGWKPYVHKYHDRFNSALDVGRYLAGEHDALLKRIVAWQQALYTTEQLPGWLQDSLINMFHNIPQSSFWAASREPDHWAGRQGLFAMNESLLSCPQFPTTCDWIANFPILFFFPELALRSLEALTYRQKEDGEIPFSMGGGTVMDDPYYGVQYSTDSQVYIHLVDRLWQRTGDDAMVRKFYPAVKKAVRFLQSLDEDGDGIVDVFGASWVYEGFPVKGASAYVGGLWRSTLRLAMRMAQFIGDQPFETECQSWFDRAGRSMESLWNEESGSYLLCLQPDTGWRSDVILSDQLAGQWACHFHGVESVFTEQRVDQVLQTVWRINVPASDAGVCSTMYPNRTPYAGGYIAVYGTLIPAMLKMYSGDVDVGLQPAHSMWRNMTLTRGYTWDQPAHLRANGEQVVGHDYYHNSMLWALPAAVLNQDMATFCAPEGLVERLIKAAQPQHAVRTD